MLEVYVFVLFITNMIQVKVIWSDHIWICQSPLNVKSRTSTDFFQEDCLSEVIEINFFKL